MRRIIHTILIVSLCSAVQAQTADTTIYQAVEEMPRFPGCEMLDTTVEVKSKCATQQLLNFMYNNIRYPQQAIQEEIEGMVVLTFVVEKEGTISNLKILKDIGGGCGLEAMRVAAQMNDIGVRWIPGKKDGVDVRSQFTLPIRFKIEDPLPYILVDRDTVYTQYDEPLSFDGGADSLAAYLNKRLRYPESVTDTCIIGRLEVEVLVQPDKRVRILDITDYNNLGFEFWYEAVAATTSTYGKWKPAVYEGREVPASFSLAMAFTPENAACKTTVDRYQEAINLAEEGSILAGEEKYDEAIAKMSQAVEMFPEDGNFLILRGQTYLDANRLPEACEDISKARDITLIDWYDNILPLLCRPGAGSTND
ncbi:MAG: TonB family protein [Saprospiraceae bacterium]